MHYTRHVQELAFGEGGMDNGEDAEIILHELGHRLHDWLTHGAKSCVERLSEGFTNYLAVSYTCSLGCWSPNNPEYHWVHKWDGHN